MLPAATAAILVVVLMVLMLMIAIRPVLMAATTARSIFFVRTALPAGQQHKDKSDEQHKNQDDERVHNETDSRREPQRCRAGNPM
jgi:hypothetical protein